MRILVAMSGGVDSSVVAGLLHEAGHEVIGVTLQLYDHGAATGRKGACCAGQDIHDARAGGRSARHPALRDRRRGAVRRCGDRRLRRQLRGRRDAGALRALQPDGEVRRPDGAGARARGASGWRPGTMCGGSTAPDGPELHRAADLARDQSWFLFATTREQLALRAVSAGRDAGQGGGARRGRAARSAGGRQARQPGHLLRPVGQLRRYGGAAAPGRAAKRATSSIGRAGCWAGTTASRATRWVRRKRLGAAAIDRGRATGGGGARCRRGGGSSSARASRARELVRLREVNWLASPPGAPLRCPVKLRAREAPQPAPW